MSIRFTGSLPRSLVRFGHRNPRAVLAGALVVIASGVLLGAHLKFETDVLNLMPRHDPVLAEFRRVLEEFGSLETLLLAVPVPSEDALERTLSFVDALEKGVSASPYLVRVDAHLEDPVRLADAVLRHATLFLDRDGLAALGARLTDAGLEARAADIRADLDTPHGMVAKELAVRDPLGFLPWLLARLNRTPASLKVDFSSGYYLAADHSLVLILAKPKGPAQDIDFDAVLLADLRARIAKVRSNFAEDQEVGLSEVPEVTIGGGHRIAFEDATLIKSDIVSNSVSSVVGVLLLFFFAYRRFATAHYAFMPLGTGLAATFIFAAVTLGQLNSATSGFSALLVGLGIDFTIVTYGRYLEGRLAGLPVAESLDVMALQTGPAVVLGAMTTVGTFFAFLATRFTGLREFGLLTGTGIVFMGAAAFLILPALVTLFDRDLAPPQPSRWLRPAGVMRWAAAHRRFVLLGAALLSVAAVLALFSISFDDDVRNLRSPANQGVAVQEKAARAFGFSFNSMMIRVEARDLDTVLTKVHQLAAALDQLVDTRVLSGYESLANLVPPRAAQEQALAWLAAHRELAEPERVRRRLLGALTSHGLVASVFEPGVAALDEALRPGGPVSLEMWRGTPVQQLVDRSLHIENGRVSTVINVYAPPGMWRREAPPQLVSLVRSVSGAHLTGVNLVAQRLRQTVWEDAVLAGVLGLVLVLVVLLYDLRSLSDSLACLLPVAVGVVWALAVMAIAKYPLNLLNVFVITMVIGVGSDYAIYILHRLREGADLEDLAQTGRAVVLSALTAIVGFGTLVTTHYPGLQSMGWMATLGVAFSCFAAVVLVPLVVRRR
ncbi:MAG: MMPL family transporter [Thermoanaerobaculales bacterium]